MTAQYKTRRSHRTAVSGTTALRHHVYTVKVRIHDVSTEGFMAECVEPVRIGSYVSLDVPGIGAVNAQVRWQLGDKMGGQFVDPISLARCDWTATPVADAA
jgi:hypothetical protein